MHPRLLYCLLLFPYSAVAQMLHGVVIDAASHKPLMAVTVVNTLTHAVSYTDAIGYYSIPAQLGDKVAFTYIGYKTVRKTRTIGMATGTLNVTMEKVVYELEELYLRPGKLTQYQLDSINRVETYKIQLDRRRPSPFMSPVSAIAEKFSKKAKRTYRFQKDFARGEAEKFIDLRYTKETVTTLTGLTGDTLGIFMNAYPMPYDFARAATNLELKMWIRDNYKQWIKKASDTVAR